jgi:predicted PilT family ATPase
VALGVAPVFVTGDNRQAEAARAEGLEVLVPA